MSRIMEDLEDFDIFADDETEKRSRRSRELGLATLRAREIFFYGNGDGKPVRNLKKLGELSGASPRTLEVHIEKWRLESEEMARMNAGKRGEVHNVTIEAVEWQKAKVLALKKECDRLEIVIAKLPAGSDMHSNALKLLTQTLKKWEESSGFTTVASVQETILKESAKAAQRGANRQALPPERVATGFTFDLGKGDNSPT